MKAIDPAVSSSPTQGGLGAITSGLFGRSVAGGVGGTSGPGWQATGPAWGDPDDEGWRLWGEPFTLPVTAANWPARYYGALDPVTTPAALVAARDAEECSLRLDGLLLAAGLSAAQQAVHFANLRVECERLVSGWPAASNFSVPLQSSPDGASAPQLGFGLVEQLQVSALSPYFARAAGLYYVDTQADPGVSYDYCVAGVWPEFVAPLVLYPGSAPRGGLAVGSASVSGMTITADNATSRLYAWSGGKPDPAAPSGVAAAFAQAYAGVPTAGQPPAMLGIDLSRPRRLWQPPVPVGTSLCSIALPNPVAELAIAVAGTGTVTATAAGTVVTQSDFSSPTLTWVTLAAPSPVSAPIDTIGIVTAAGTITGTGIVVVGGVAMVPTPNSIVGVRYAIVHAPRQMAPPSAPGAPTGIFRRRTAGVELPGPSIVARSIFDVQWVPLPSAAETGDPVTDPIGLPAPDGAVGYVAQQVDGDPAAATPLPRVIVAAPQPPPADSPLASAAAILRFIASGLPDPVAGYQWQVAGFGPFGQLGAYGPLSAPLGVERIAPAPTALRGVAFDNSPAAGGQPLPSADPTEWSGGTLSLRVLWPGSSLLMYPDAKTARLTVQTLDATGQPDGTTATADFDVPAPAIGAYILSQLVPDPANNVVYAVTSPPLPAADPQGPSASLALTGILPDGTAISERYAVLPGPVGPTIAATLPATSASRLVTSPQLFVGQPAYLVSGVTVPLSVSVPLAVPAAQATVRAQATVQASYSTPFDPNETVTDPNGAAPGQAEPVSAPAVFTAPQRLTPPAPPTPEHLVAHRFYAPADAAGNATYAFDPTVAGGVGWDTSAGSPYVSGYLLERAPGHALALADVKRRLTAGLADPNPVIAGRADLAAWIADLPGWLSAYNVRTYGTSTGAYLTPVTALSDAAAQRSFIDHFYGGLLDDELCVLADVPANLPAFARVSGAPSPPGVTVTDTVNGNGYGRSLYRLFTANAAGSLSDRSGAAGPVYTRPVRPSRPPVLYRVQPAPGAFVAAWVLDDNPNVAGYLLYRATDRAELADLRYFGPSPALPLSPAALAAPVYQQVAWQGFALSPGATDPRLTAVVNDPRLFARDYTGSDMAEIPLPPGGAPDEVLGVYRLAEFSTGAAPGQQPQAFNYWLPDTGSANGTATVVTEGSGAAASSRITGLRLGLGQGVPVVVVARYGQVIKTLGALPSVGGVQVRRIGFTDGAVTGSNPPAPLDPRAAPGWTPPGPGANYYTVVAVDIAGNVSAAATPYGASPMLVAS